MNIGNFDRVFRIILGLALIIAPFVTSFSMWDNSIIKIGAIFIGVVLIATAQFRFCPLYRLVGIRTCKF